MTSDRSPPIQESSPARLTVEVQSDFIERQVRAEPIAALAELIWNAFDGDALHVNVTLDRNPLGRLSRIIVTDNGLGFGHAEAGPLFANLGGSWKRTRRRTLKYDRAVHGQEGRGRYKALALGGHVTWHVCHELPDKSRQSFDIVLKESDIRAVELSVPATVEDEPTGTIVTIDNVKRDFRLFSSDDGRQRLAEQLAAYLINYRDVTVAIDGEPLDPTTAVKSQETLQLAMITDEEGRQHPVQLLIIEWHSGKGKSLYLCDTAGFPLLQTQARFSAGPRAFAAYLKSSLIEDLHRSDRLRLGDMLPALKQLVDSARGAVDTHFRALDAKQAQSVVEQWKAERTYPYEGDPSNPVEVAERQVFDIVAVNLHSYSSDIQAVPARARALHLRLLRSAIEHSPEDLQLIFNEVLQLPATKQKELAELLRETTLSAIITAAKTVADRLKFISSLDTIVFDPTRKTHLKERTQLHRILARNSWVFGEEYNLWVDDGDLKRVLEQHRKHLDPSIVIDDPVQVIGQKRGIVDLMLSRATRRHRADDIEHLVVELKAPRTKLNADATTQIKKYAQAVTSDPRFATVPNVRWHFWLVNNAYDDTVRDDIEGGPDPLRRLIRKTDRYQIGVKTWGELIEENRARLQFFQEHLQHAVDKNDALAFLRQKYGDLLVGVVDDTNETVETDHDPERADEDDSISPS